MSERLESLLISEREVETLTGLEVSPIFVGGALTGIYRPSVLGKPGHRLYMLLTELIVAALLFMVAIPIGLFFTRGQGGGIQTSGEIARFLLLTTLLTIAGLGLRYRFMRARQKRLRRLLSLLDKVEQFNDMMRAIALSHQLSSTAPSKPSNIHAALELTRNNLTYGLTIERILRENQGLLTRQQELLNSIEANLVTLRSLELEQQAITYQQLIQEAFEIGLSVQQELQKVAR